MGKIRPGPGDGRHVVDVVVECTSRGGLVFTNILLKLPYKVIVKGNRVLRAQLVKIKNTALYTNRGTQPRHEVYLDRYLEMHTVQVE